MGKKALVIVDMSNDFVDDDGTLTVGKPAQEIVPYILEQAQAFVDNGDVVVFTMDAHELDDEHFDLWPPHNIIGTGGQALYGDLNIWHEFNEHLDNVLYMPKTNYNAFFETPLADKLRFMGVEEVHVVGVCTDICNYLTLAGADAEGFKTAVHVRGCATFTDKGRIFIDQAKLCFHTEIID